MIPGDGFFLFGLGPRRKLVYQRGRLMDAFSGATTREWRVSEERLRPSDYRVELETAEAGPVAIWEDEQGLWLEENGARTALSESLVRLPTFAGHSHAGLLRVLHQELLVNLVPAGPVPNLFVYRRPWYRDAAMVCMCLEQTGNLHLVRDWILGLSEPFDGNNAGNREPDNLGEALHLISLVSSASHPLVPALLEAAAAMTVDGHLTGPTDGGEHPVYQTKWLKYGLRRLGLADPYTVPEAFDSYGALFWMSREGHVEGPRFSEEAGRLYPYLRWAEAHCYREPPPLHLLRDGYPLTWESHASEADYAGMQRISPACAAAKTCTPHTWHAAEAFLYLHELG